MKLLYSTLVAYPFPLLGILPTREKLIKALVENGADVNIKDNLNRTPLSEAVMKQDIETIQYLIQNGANTKDLDYRVIEKKYSDENSRILRKVEIFLDHNRFETNVSKNILLRFMKFFSN